jgi:hypothetical protein
MRLALLALAPLVPAALGCAGAVSGEGSGDAEAVSTTSAVVSVQRTADSTEGSRAEASARFIRVTGSSSPDDALRAIGATLDLPARGSCASLASLGDAPAAQAQLIELVDVGDISLQVNGVETRLSARQLPDVTDIVSGVVYARATDPALLPAGAPYLLHVGGAHGLPPVDVVATAPADPADVLVAGEDTPGSLEVTAASGSTIGLSWASDPLDDTIYVDVRPSDVRCVLDAGGHGTVSTLLLDDAGTLVVHRLHREPLRATGVDAGEIRFDFARTVTYVHH